MKTKYTILAFLAILMAFASCSSSDKELDNNGNDYKNYFTFQGAINDMAVGTEKDTIWPKNHIIGATLKSANISGADNMRYITFKGDGNFVPANKYTDIIFYPEDNQVIDFIAYSPYQADIKDNIYKVDLTNQRSQEKVDLVYSDNAKDQSGNLKVDLKFQHKLAKLVFLVSAAPEVNGVVGLETQLSGIPAKAGISLTDFTITDPVNEIITAKTTITAGVSYAEAVILPGSGADRKVVLSINGIPKEVVLPTSYMYEAGKKHFHAITITEDGAILNPNIQVKEWSGSSNEDIVADPNQTADGSKAKPYYSSSLTKEKVGEKEVWITGIIMNGTPKGGKAGTVIYIAEKLGEKSIRRYTVLNLANSPVAEKLNTDIHKELIGKQIRVKANIVNDEATDESGKALVSLNNVTEQVGGFDKPIIIKEFFSESLGVAGAVARPAVDNFEGFDMKSPVKYSSGEGSVTMREAGKFPDMGLHVWLPKHEGKTANNLILVIDGIESQDYTALTLSYDLAAGVKATPKSTLIVKCNGQSITLPSSEFASNDTYETIEVAIPDGTTKIEFCHITQTEGHMRLDNIKIKGQLKD